MTWKALKCPDIEVTGIPLGSAHSAPGSIYNHMIDQFQRKLSPRLLLAATKETPDAICRKLNRMMETDVIIMP
ncbi:MAG: hypothetical protein RDV48_13455 [Candidatus Eremiobacteraeota bacterium]|nr:hypothetical protein [Candidatus Eremiobacteraeota bacterium]